MKHTTSFQSKAGRRYEIEFTAQGDMIKDVYLYCQNNDTYAQNVLEESVGNSHVFYDFINGTKFQVSFFIRPNHEYQVREYVPELIAGGTF